MTGPDDITCGEVDSAAALAGQAAEAIRSLNLETLPADGAPALTHPADVDSVIAGLMIMAQRLPQLLGQLAAYLEREHAAGRVGDDRRTDPAPTVAAVIGRLGQAAVEAAELAGTLERAQNTCAHLTGTAA